MILELPGRQSGAALGSGGMVRILAGGIAAAVAVMAVAGCGGGGRPATTSSPTQIFIPKTSESAAATAACYVPSTAMVDTINQLLTGGEHLEHAQAVDGPGNTTYIGGNIFDASGQKLSSQDTWVEAEGLMFSITSDARSRSAAPDGRKLAGIKLEWPTYNTAVNRCVGAVERAENAGG